MSISAGFEGRYGRGFVLDEFKHERTRASLEIVAGFVDRFVAPPVFFPFEGNARRLPKKGSPVDRSLPRFRG